MNLPVLFADTGHKNSGIKIGSPGKASAATRTIEVSVFDNYYEPKAIEVKKGETVRFVIKNKGQFVHEFNIGTAAMHAEHQKQMVMMVEHGVLEADKINHNMMRHSAVSADTYNLNVEQVTIDTGSFKRKGVGYNGSSPGPILRFKEGEDITINVTNKLKEDTSVHWHGIILPYEHDGVPQVSFKGIAPGETFTYRFTAVQSGTYWYHSHSGMQEPDGAYGAIIIEPKTKDPFAYDREYVIQLSDPHKDSGHTVMRNLKKNAAYYNRTQPSVMDFFADVKEKGFTETVKNRYDWGDMRMMSSDIEDVQGFDGTINGRSASQNWTGLFEPGERIRLRLINSSASAFFDVYIPGLTMLVVQADGNNVQPVKVDELRLGIAETYDVIIRPEDDKAYTVFAESMGRTGFARATLAPKEGMSAEVPKMRKQPRLSMSDMGMMDGMDHSSMAGMDHSKMSAEEMAAMTASDKFYNAGSGLLPKAYNGGKFLSYSNLKAFKPLYAVRAPDREIEIRLTGNMERYIWSINGVKYEDAEPLVLKEGERVRFKFVNETMMMHPMHLHGMWMILDNGSGKFNPAKHTINIAPGATSYAETEADAPGNWVFHCHIAYHMDTGMFRKIIIESKDSTSPEKKR
ncbi:hypothetical protein CHS0354_013126 [Potamilus streckersoni]|uniref:Copper oxidase n=1 Tax=Potamilus streckersoni TaxID=2493646 RepID=A0AAE0S6B7_9BIVA|nr:hypothetical protein CHS0354_013126 [Potamilus streckersoni]